MLGPTWSNLGRIWVNLMHYWTQKTLKIIDFHRFLKHFCYVGFHALLKPCWAKLAAMIGNLRSTWAQFGWSWTQLCPSSGQLELLGGIFGPTWATLKPTWRQQQLCWDQLRPYWCQLGLSRAILESIWNLHGAKLGEFCTILCDFGTLLMSLEPF